MPKQSVQRQPHGAPSNPSDSLLPSRADFKLWAICASSLLAVWALIYLPYLSTSPRWYGDEFVTLMAGNSILNGTFANRALHYSFFSGFTNYQPAACLLYAMAGHLTSDGVLGARLLATILGFLTAFAAFHLLFIRGLVIEGLASAIVILCAPESVIHFRWVYPHFFVSLAVVVIGLTLDLPRTPKRDWIIGLACAFAALGHLLLIHVTLAALVCRWRYPSAWLRVAIPPAVVVLLSLCFGYLISGRQLFSDLYEVGLQYTTHNDDNTLAVRLNTFVVFFTWDWVHVLYVVGIVLTLIRRRWTLAAFAILLTVAVIQNRPELPIFYYQAMIFAPLLGVCLACGLQATFEWLLHFDKALAKSLWPRLLLAAILPAILFVTAACTISSGKIISRNDYWLAPSDEDLRATADWVNAHAGKDELVVSYWDLGWMLKGRWTDMLQCAVWEDGACPEFYKRQRDRSEFIFPADMSTARYIIIGPLDRGWAIGVHKPVLALLQKLDVEHWPRVAGTATTFVLENPHFHPAPSK